MKKKEVNKKRLFKIVLPYMRMIYKDNYDEKLKKLYLPLYEESEKKKINYSVVDRIPKNYINEAMRFYFPQAVDYIFGFIMFISISVYIYFFRDSNHEMIMPIVGGAAMIYGLLFAVIEPLRMDGPKIKSLRFLIDKKSIKQTCANISTAILFWLFIALVFYGFICMILITIYSVFFALFGLIFALIFYKLRYDR